MIRFDLQRFGGGKGGTTITQTYEPTEWELGLQKLEYHFSANFMEPHAEKLSTAALNHFNKSGSSFPVNYAEFFLDADDKIKAGQAGLAEGLGDLLTNAPPTPLEVSNSITQANNEYLTQIFEYNSYYLTGAEMGLRNWINDVPVELYKDLKSLKSNLAGEVTRVIGNYGSGLQTLAGGLATIPGAYMSAGEAAENALTACGDGLSVKAATSYY